MSKRLQQFAADDNLQVDADAAPASITLKISQPDGTPAKGLLVRLAGGSTEDGDLPAATAIARRPLADGSVTIPLPTTWHKPRPTHLDLVIVGGDGSVPFRLDWEGQAEGDVLPIALPRQVPPAPLALFEKLTQLAEGEEASVDGAAKATPVRPLVGLGEGECAVTFGTDTSQDRYPFSLLFRLTDPGLSLGTLVMRDPDGRSQDVLRAVYPDVPPATIMKSEFRLVNRVGIERPISAEAFRRGIAGISTPRRIP
ncbi:MAG TPA: hypothetical protein VM913_06830, partial [Sphingomicrobium sp.]|nr:hypothetical protein [Sphingomicrobium sp.]